MKTKWGLRTAGIVMLLSAALMVTSCIDCIEGNNQVVTRSIKAGEFTGIKLSCDARVILVADSAASDSLVLQGESNILDLIEVEESGNALRIDSKKCYSSNKQVVITIPVKSLAALKVNGSGGFESEGTIRCNDLELQINGSGSIELALEAAEINSQINGSGDVNLKGSAQNHKVEINGSGNVNAFEMPAGKTYITVNGSGDCRVFTTTLLDVEIRGSGNVFYKGSPDINSSVKGSGSVRKED
jgi:hypothetical protein